MKDSHPAAGGQRSGKVYGTATWAGDPMAAYESSFRALGDFLALETPSTHMAALESFKDLLRGYDITSSMWNNVCRRVFGRHDDDDEYTGAGTGRTTRDDQSFRENAESAITGSSPSSYDVRRIFGAASKGVKRSVSMTPFVYGPKFTADTCVAYVLNLRRDTQCS